MIATHLIDRWFVDNPLYRPASHGRTRGGRVVTLVVGMVVVVFYLQVLVGPTAFIGGRTLSLFLLSGLLQWPVALLVHLLAPAMAATAIAAERTRGTLEMLVITPFPRRAMLIGLTVERLRPIAECLLLCLPGYLVQNYLWRESWDIAGILLGLAAGLSALCGLAFTSAAGVYASVRIRSEAGAVAMAIVMVIVLRWIIGFGANLLYLFTFFFGGYSRSLEMQAVVLLMTMAIQLWMAWRLLNSAASRMEDNL